MLEVVTGTTLALVRPAVDVRPFRVEIHLQSAVEALLNLRRNEGLYPPKDEVKASANATDLAYWLLNEDVLGRWVAVAHGRVVGHISVTAPPHLADAFTGTGQEFPATSVRVSKFFVEPRTRGQGAGALLFDQALRFSRQQGLQLGASVDATSLAARRFFVQNGMTEAADIRGTRGRTFVFVDNPGRFGWEPAVADLAA